MSPYNLKMGQRKTSQLLLNYPFCHNVMKRWLHCYFTSVHSIIIVSHESFGIIDLVSSCIMRMFGSDVLQFTGPTSPMSFFSPRDAVLSPGILLLNMTKHGWKSSKPPPISKLFQRSNLYAMHKHVHMHHWAGRLEDSWVSKHLTSIYIYIYIYISSNIIYIYIFKPKIYRKVNSYFNSFPSYCSIL